MEGDPGMMDPGLMEDPGTENGGFPKWGWALIVLAVLTGGIITAVVLLKKRKKRRAAELEAELAEDAEDFVSPEDYS
jgi:hypothetical protein